MNKSYLLIILIILILPGSSFSGNASRYFSKYKKVQSFQANYVQKKYLTVMKEPLLSYGVIKYKVHRKLAWIQKKPHFYKFILNGKKVVKEYPQLEEREVFDLDSDVQMKAIFENIFILMGLKSESKVKNVYHIYVNDYHKMVTLVPKNKELKNFIEKITLKFHNNYLINWIRLNEKKGNYTIIHFQNIKLNNYINDEEFKVD